MSEPRFLYMPSPESMKSEPDDKLVLLAGGSDGAIANLAKNEIQRRRDKKAQEDSDRKEEARQKQEAHKIEREDGRFQIQFAETRRQNWWTRCLSILAVAISGGSLVVAICALSARKAQSPQPEPPRQQPAPALLFSATNATPTNPMPLPTPKP